MALAYLDPGSGSLIASALVGGVAAAGVAAKQARMRFAGKFSKKQRSTDDTTVEAGDADATASDS